MLDCDDKAQNSDDDSRTTKPPPRDILIELDFIFSEEGKAKLHISVFLERED